MSVVQCETRCVSLDVGFAEETAMQGEGGSRGVHWGLVLSSVCGAVLLLGLVAIVAMSVYAYRQRHRKSHRW